MREGSGLDARLPVALYGGLLCKAAWVGVSAALVIAAISLLF